MKFNIQRKGRAWKGDEAHQKYQLTPEKIEMFNGQIFWSDEERLNMLGLLLENVGLDKALKLCDINMVKDALKDLEKK